jgi:hypothetical protein
MDESLRWLVANGYSDRAETIIRFAAKRNNVSYDEVIRKSTKCVNTELHEYESKPPSEAEAPRELTIKEETSDMLTNRGQASANVAPAVASVTSRKLTVIDIFKERRILVASLILWYTW